MSADQKSTVSCYNRGCGADFDPLDNKDDSCRHHPGVPFFHDAYKGWSCCNKKSVDFTEFLNIKGCQLAKHSNVKPAEPVKPRLSPHEEAAAAAAAAAPAQPVRKPIEPIKPSQLQRPDFEQTPLQRIEPIVAPALRQAIDAIVPIISRSAEGAAFDAAAGTHEPIGAVLPGTICKNGGCGQAYESPASNQQPCVHHPGVPVFHEGLKYWSCCTKRTSDFAQFLAQRGCQTGVHRWFKNSDESESLKCRYDWHQTATTVVLAIYAKMYHYAVSSVEASPVRLRVALVFPQQNDAEFNMDLELRGIIDVAATKVQFFGTKCEVTMTKAEPGHWNQFEVPRHRQQADLAAAAVAADAAAAAAVPNANDDDGIESDVDLDDIEAIRGVTISDQPAPAPAQVEELE